MFFNKVQTLPEQTADKIIQYIINNNLQPNDKIPNEAELGEILSVGRSTIREAVRILVSRNVLTIKRGSGTYVAKNTGISDDPLGLVFSKDKFKLAKDLLEIRIILEPEIASMAANMASKRDIEEIWKRCEKVEEIIHKGEDHMADDVKFHQAIAKCTGNDVIEKIVPIINTSVRVFVNITSGKLKSETIKTHRAIAKAISEHNAKEARHAMMMHMLYNKYKIYEIIENNTPKQEPPYKTVT